MSLKTWKAAFYPITAQTIVSLHSDTLNEAKTQLILIDHSLNKWQGVKQTNLDIHRLSYSGHAIIIAKSPDLDLMRFDAKSCSLCQAYYNADIPEDEPLPYDPACETCPIVKVTDKDCQSSWRASGRDPAPMIQLLTEVRQAVARGIVDAPDESSLTQGDQS